ncbi:MAG TPA: SRPBCC domain-containing protein, partial [Actinomycetes bacterium]|nr:SRPBCC domain-containing protein [Actinomycetes bacterium]
MTPEHHDPAAAPRAIDLDIEVPGTPEEVWEAVASGPGITAWFVPATVEGRVGGKVELDFGPGYGVETAQVTAWDPPRRFAAEVAASEGRPPFAMEWLVEARDGGTCVVRLINSGFGSDAGWDAEYDATQAGWRLFLDNLRLYLTHFPGQPASTFQVMGIAPEPPSEAWAALTGALGLTEPVVGQRIGTSGEVPPLAGTVA